MTLTTHIRKEKMMFTAIVISAAILFVCAACYITMMIID